VLAGTDGSAASRASQSSRNAAAGSRDSPSGGTTAIAANHPNSSMPTPISVPRSVVVRVERSGANAASTARCAGAASAARSPARRRRLSRRCAPTISYIHRPPDRPSVMARTSAVTPPLTAAATGGSPKADAATATTASSTDTSCATPNRPAARLAPMMSGMRTPYVENLPGR
jgi:hypothetical protein